MIPPTYHVQLNYYQYITELSLMIHKYIPYSAYQVKTANCRQPIQAPLKYIMQEQQVVKLMARSMAEHEFKL